MDADLDLMEYKVYHKNKLVDANSIPVRLLDIIIGIYRIPTNSEYYVEYTYQGNTITIGSSLND